MPCMSSCHCWMICFYEIVVLILTINFCGFSVTKLDLPCIISTKAIDLPQILSFNILYMPKD